MPSGGCLLEARHVAGCVAINPALMTLNDIERLEADEHGEDFGTGFEAEQLEMARPSVPPDSSRMKRLRRLSKREITPIHDPLGLHARTLHKSPNLTRENKPRQIEVDLSLKRVSDFGLRYAFPGSRDQLAETRPAREERGEGAAEVGQDNLQIRTPLDGPAHEEVGHDAGGVEEEFEHGVGVLGSQRGGFGGGGGVDEDGGVPAIELVEDRVEGWVAEVATSGMGREAKKPKRSGIWRFRSAATPFGDSRHAIWIRMAMVS
ncbi:hypothetical protein KC338_g76 [Hortaea werneckii]|nr:hypothetical protein KC338_g76 [Hortaea werneckii]